MCSEKKIHILLYFCHILLYYTVDYKKFIFNFEPFDSAKGQLNETIVRMKF